MAGSVWGGRWSDYELARLKAANGGNSYPEVRIPNYCTMYTLFIARGAHRIFIYILWRLLFINL